MNWNQLMTSFSEFFNSRLVPALMGISLAVFVVLAIINGIRRAKAVTDEERQKANHALIGLVIGAGIVAVALFGVPALFGAFREFFSAGDIDLFGST